MKGLLKTILIVMMSSQIISCMPVVKQAVGVGKATNDTALETAEFTICNAASVGSVRRKFGTKDRAQVWRDLCTSDSDFNPEH